MSHPDDWKRNDPYRFIKADEWFADIDNAANVSQPETIAYNDADQPKRDGKVIFTHGKVFRFNDNSFLLVQFVRPKVWRIRFNPEVKDTPKFSDFNSRTIIFSTMPKLIERLDALEGISWKVELIDVPFYYILQSVMDPGTEKERPEVQLWIQKDPFRIVATRLLKTRAPAVELPVANTQDEEIHAKLNLKPVEGTTAAVIWRTRPKPLRYRDTSTVFTIGASATARYMGFGEQGGTDLFKQNTYMNYFNFDNMKYQNVYANGPLDDREPLYHSEPFWMEAASLTQSRAMLATMVDNYSHVCVDIRRSSYSSTRVATRFSEFNIMVVAADFMAELVKTYTSIIGKPMLKPRYVLGYHQGCYGYDQRPMVENCIDEYHKVNFPIDGIHIDVDMQRKLKTFTIDESEKHFPNAAEMFRNLRIKGVKACTNITPYINLETDPQYSTLNEMLANKYFLSETRDLHPQVTNADLERYQIYDFGNQNILHPQVQRPPYDPPDNVPLSETFNKGKDTPFRGGVYYGWGNGAPGHYPNLNSFEVRKWWGKQYTHLFETGLEFVWQDMTSPCIAEQYGDMKSIPFRLLVDCDYRAEDPNPVPAQKKVLEIWSLLSYNLHKATFHGLERLHEGNDKLKWRENRRNFIIGRGSFIGSHRFAGLWTGDNQSTWDFLNISVVQVLALGISGLSITGQDVGGFEFTDAEHDFPNPELIIRWYCAYSLLPWFRNHYTMKRFWFDGPKEGQLRKDGKLFQEPWAYEKYYQENQWRMNEREKLIYRSVLPITRYYVRLRYSLMQLLYDAMFENTITGLPIARSMVITDDQDQSLFSTNKDYTGHQYMVRHDLLVAPRLSLEQASDPSQPKDVRLYLPYADRWFPMNLGPDQELGRPLNDPVDGGNYVDFWAPISDDYNQMPYVTPMFIREGAIIPQIGVRMSTPDYYPDGTYPEVPKPTANPITIHSYPGKKNLYSMFLDDGISRDADPFDRVAHSKKSKEEEQRRSKAANKYAEVQIEHQTFVDTQNRWTRVLQMKAPINNIDDQLEGYVGPTYKVVFWHERPHYSQRITVVSQPNEAQITQNDGARATIATFPSKLAHTKTGITITLTYG